MMIYLDHESYDRFFDLLFDERYLKLSTEENQRMLDFYLNHIKVAHTTVGYSLIDQREAVAQSMGVPHSRPLDVAFPIAMMLMQEWRKDVSDGITLIHDKSSRMTEVMHMWNTIFHHHPPPALQQMYAGTRKSAMGLAGTSAQDSKDWRGIQLADILAGATRTWVHWLLGGRNPDDAFGTNLDTIMVLFQPIPNWPVAPVTPEYFVKAGLTEEEARAQDELGEKLTTFHRIRAGGYTYRVFPEENE